MAAGDGTKYLAQQIERHYDLQVGENKKFDASIRNLDYNQKELLGELQRLVKKLNDVIDRVNVNRAAIQFLLTFAEMRQPAADNYDERAMCDDMNSRWSESQLSSFGVEK